MAWEVDWSHSGNTGSKVWARNPTSHWSSAREWHWVATGALRKAGVSTPTYRKDSWQIDWGKRKGKRVWARNPVSKSPSARKWHWISHKTLDQAGIPWKPANRNEDGRYKNSDGYIQLTKFGMTDEEVILAEKHGLFRGARKTFVHEHRLVALKKYGSLPDGYVVRHINGIKHDNRPENLTIGTIQENTMDHNSARLMAMQWHQKYEQLLLMHSRLTGIGRREIDECISSGITVIKQQQRAAG